MALYIIISIVLISASSLMAMILFRYWEIKSNRIDTKHTATEIGFFDHVHVVHKQVTTKGTHHGLRFLRFLYIRFSRLIHKLLKHHRVQNVTDMVKGRHKIEQVESLSPYLKDVKQHKEEIRREIERG